MIGLDCLVNMGEPRINPPSLSLSPAHPVRRDDFLGDASRRVLESVWTRADFGAKLLLGSANEMEEPLNIGSRGLAFLGHVYSVTPLIIDRLWPKICDNI